MQVTGARQQEAWLQRVLPPVEEVATGVWSVPVPIPDNPLRYVLSYLIEHDRGVVMVDTGWNHPDSWRALTEGLAICGIPMPTITAVLITHVHPDHHGLSGEVRDRCGGWIGMHEGEDAWLAEHASEFSDRADGRADNSAHARSDGRSRFLRWCGAPTAHTDGLASYRRSADRPRPMVRADRTIAHGDLIDLPGLRLRALWTPGHSPGHLCFHDETHDLMLTGDHVLPRITPNISAYDLAAHPLEDYLRSLDALRGIQPREVLPAHEYRFSDLDARLDALVEHHRERLDEVAQVLRAAPDGLSTWQVAEQVSWSRGWDQLSGFPRQAALGEVLAHLRHLQYRGALDCVEAHGVGHWRPTR